MLQLILLYLFRRIFEIAIIIALWRFFFPYVIGDGYMIYIQHLFAS